MRARGRLLSCLATIVIALAGFVTAGTLPAAAAASPVQYVALGDSYAAGIGAPPYQSVSLGDKICIQSINSGYPVLLDAKGRIDLQDKDNATCPGFTTTDVANNLPSGLDEDTRLVTLTVGGNDLNLRDVLMTCMDPATPEAACLAAIDNAVAPDRRSDLRSDLAGLYAQVALKAPEARIIVTGYPILFEPDADFSPEVINAVDAAGVLLNETIEDAVAAANEDDVNIHYVDVTEEFAGHGVVTRITNPNDPKAFIHSPLVIIDSKLQPDPAAFHPNDKGYSAYADAISAALPGGWLKELSA